MTHARTLTRYACLAGLIAGLLAPVSSLAQQLPPSSPSPLATVTRVTGAGTSGSDILARVTANTKPQAIGSRIYWTQQIPVARSTLRIGALSALGRGIMHPGFQVAIVAAGFIWSEELGIHTISDFSPVPDGSEIAYGADIPLDNELAGHYYTSPYSSSKFQTPGAAISSVPVTGRVAIYHFPDTNIYHVRWRCDPNGFNCNSGPAVISPEPGDYDFAHPEHSVSPVPESDYSQLDPHLPPELADQLWNGEPIPEWQEAISVIGIPATEVESKGQDMPEVATKVAQRAANIISQLLGEESPYPETGTGGQTADDEMVDMWNEPIPDFPEAEPEWQVEEITSLPDFSFGLGSGSCPAPVTIPHPLGGSFTIEFQKLCDLASMIRGAVIAICMILALYIVLGTRATTS